MRGLLTVAGTLLAPFATVLYEWTLNWFLQTMFPGMGIIDSHFVAILVTVLSGVLTLAVIVENA